MNKYIEIIGGGAVPFSTTLVVTILVKATDRRYNIYGVKAERLLRKMCNM